MWVPRFLAAPISEIRWGTVLKLKLFMACDFPW
jgi:hypothetical protein